ncbi:MAG TPA: methyl-accepting chemotaxis protein [Sphingomonas sp.]|nr:methyl-accepting chemotaxis protein [Sphingomonas sp.]
MSSINRRASQAAIVMVGLVTLSGGTGIWAAWEQSSALRSQTEVASLLRNHMQADMMHDAIRADALAALQAADPASGINPADVAKDLAEHVGQLKEAIAADTAYAGSAQVADAARALPAAVDAYIRAAGDVVALAGRDATAAERGLPGFFEQFRALEGSMERTSDAIEGHAEEVANAAERLGWIAMIVLVVALAGAILVTALLSAAVRRVLVNPLLALAATMRELGAGKLQVDIPSTGRDDELGDMAQAMESFRAQLDAAEAAKAAQTRLIVDSIGTGLDALAEGDLTARIHAELTGPFAGLKTSFNGAMQSLAELIGTVTASAANIRTGSAEIAQASEDLAKRTEANAASLEETSASITILDERLRAVADAAGRTVESADEAIAVVGDGRSRASDATHAMQRVSESAKGIDDVIEGLDKIAFQTRVLAMNAAVEAGRAGEAGRGFAVVADLVSALAMRAEEEAKRAREQLTVTQSEVGTAASMVTEVDSALVRIAGAVEAVHGLLGNMASENRVQAAAVGEISAAVGTMDRATQQNAAMVEETSAAARNLMNEVALLTEQAAQFTVAQSGAPARRPTAAAAAALTMH